jgi:hypothetical protein
LDKLVVFFDVIKELSRIVEDENSKIKAESLVSGQ